MNQGQGLIREGDLQPQQQPELGEGQQQQQGASEKKDSESGFRITAWKRGPKAPTKLQRGSSTVIGNVVYFSPLSSDIVYAFTCTTTQWSTLQSCPYEDFTLTNINAQLTTVGGCDYNSWPPAPTNKVFTHSTDEKWIEQYPPMPTKRKLAAVHSTNTHVIVIGGSDGVRLTATEILDLETQQWSTASPVPYGIYLATMSLCGETLYLMGGNTVCFNYNLLTCNIKELLQSTHLAVTPSSTETQPPPSPTHTKVWHMITGVPVSRSASANIQGHLLSIGGKDEHNKSSAQIYKFNSDTSEWSVVGHMTMPRSSCLAAVLPDNLFVVGGCDIGVTDETEISTIV